MNPKETKSFIMIYYSHNGIPECANCGFTDIRALSIDHINGGGSKHRNELIVLNKLTGTGTGSSFYRWLIDNNLPDGFQVLCMNCQFIKRVENNELKDKR